jgi:hypothetical protein
MDQVGKARQRNAAAPDAAGVIEAELASLLHLPISELRAMWRERLKCEPPKLRSRTVLLNELAWRVQVDAFGDLDSLTERRLAEIGKALERDGDYEPKVRRDFSPGVVLTREWKGTIHKVAVMAQGFQYLGKRYKSLSDIARTITGTRWSGPRFFGLEQRKKATREVAP